MRRLFSWLFNGTIRDIRAYILDLRPPRGGDFLSAVADEQINHLAGERRAAEFAQALDGVGMEGR